MAVKEIGELYRCNVCGNEVRVTKVGGGTLVCCGEDMVQVKEGEQTTVNIPDSGKLLHDQDHTRTFDSARWGCGSENLFLRCSSLHHDDFYTALWMVCVQSQTEDTDCFVNSPFCNKY